MRHILIVFYIGRYWQALHLQESTSQFLIFFLKVFKFSADFSSFGRLFQICGPIDIRLLNPKVVDMALYRLNHLDFIKNSMRSVI